MFEFTADFCQWWSMFQPFSDAVMNCGKVKFNSNRKENFFQLFFMNVSLK